MGYLSDLRAISEGYSPDIVAAYGGELCLTEGANIQAFQIKHSENAKMAKEHMRLAKDAKSKGDTAQAKKEYDAAIKCLKELQKECEKIDDDHMVMIFIETFIKTFVPMFVGTVFMSATGGISYFVGLVGGYICGMSKSLDYSAAIEKKLTTANKAGVGGKADSSQWWKAGATRGETMIKFDRMITACEKAKENL